MPRHACCLCSGHSPQSEGQPSRTSVWKVSGMVPGLLNRADARYACASPYTSASNQPCSRQRLRRYTLPLRMLTCASTTTLQTGQMLLVYSTNTSSRCCLPAVAPRPFPTTTDDSPITSTSASTRPDPAGARAFTPTSGSLRPYCAATGSYRPPASATARPTPLSHRDDGGSTRVVSAT